MRKIVFVILILGSQHCASAQTAVQMNAVEIQQNLQKLNTVGSVLYVAAHPDDENTRLLTYLSKERKVRTGYVSITRGDGGQNLVGKEQGELLGLIRTQELLAARRIDGAEQFFTRANDFGYSKSPEETFAFWNKDSILADLVWIIRNFKPDVIICRFPTTGEGGHGHHTASAILAEEAFTAAADEKKFPHQLQHTGIWQTKRLFWNTFSFGSVNTTAANQLKIDVGMFNPLLGKGYGEIAADSRSMHKSQGFGASKTRGTSIEYFKLLKGDTTSRDLFAGTDLSWKRFSSTSGFTALIDNIIKKFDPLHPEKSVPDLVSLYSKMKEIKSGSALSLFYQKQKLVEVQNLILACSGLWMEAYSSKYRVTRDSHTDINLQMVNRNGADVTLVDANYYGKMGFNRYTSLFDTTFSKKLEKNELFTYKHKTHIDTIVTDSNPYWLCCPHSPGLFEHVSLAETGRPENEPALVIDMHLKIAGTVFTYTCPVTHKTTDPVRGEVYRPLEVLPDVTINFSENVFMFVEGLPRTIECKITAHTDNVSGTLALSATGSWGIKLEQSSFTLKKAGEEIILKAVLSPGRRNTGTTLSAIVTTNKSSFNQSIQRIEYDHIPAQFVLRPAMVKAEYIALEKTKTNIAYIPGAGDDVAACLKQIGYSVTVLTDDMLSTEDLSKFSAIVTGVRLYNTNERMNVYQNRLLDYVKQGGNLVVQYNTNSRVGPLNNKIGPYAFTISRDRVTNEKAEVQIINKEEPVLNFPNKLTADDFNNWVQERGIYFATETDSAYRKVFSMNDAGEKPLDGSLIIAPFGKGKYIYTGLAFFRQLPAGVPGAYRLFVNILSLQPAK